MALFALDHNYPIPMLEPAAESLSDMGINLVPVSEIDPRLPECEDWELILALHHHKDGWDGLITNDAGILSQARELVVLGYTRLSLVAPQAAGHDPIRSTGLVLAHIQDIARRTTPRRPQIWKLHRRTSGGDHPDLWLEKEARKIGVDRFDLARQASPSREELERDPLED